LFLSLFAELWVVDDGYAGPWERYNTVYKAYNIAWLLYGLAFAGAMAAYLPRAALDWREWLRPRVARRWTALAILVIMGAAYPFAATKARIAEHRRQAAETERIALPPGPSLDAVRYYAAVNRDEYRLIEWIGANIAGKPIAAEACRLEKDSYTVQSRIATFTGIRTVAAWPQHEMNWRNKVPSSLDPREQVPVIKELVQRVIDLKVLYTAPSETLVRRIVARYGIEYIVIGRWERALYGGRAGEFLRTLYKPVFESEDVVFLKTN
jgi:uncharacterized membrane protein